MKRTCEQCNEEFELTHDHPGRSVICRNCIADPECVAKLSNEIAINGKIYKQVGLKVKSEPVYEPETRKQKKR